ncbi:MAG TPA: efflux RND transporter periplasmic adaptor subunit [Terriglobales bacterium]
MKKIFPILLLLLLIGGGMYWYRHTKASRADDTKLHLSGNIEAHESVVSFRVQGRIAELGVEEGQQVAEGAVLARLEDDDFRQQLNMDRAAERTRRAELTLVLAGSREQEIAAAEQAVAEAKADLEQKRTDLARYKALYARDAISTQSRDQAQTAFDRSQANYQRLMQQLDALREGARKEQIGVSRAGVHQAAQNVGFSKLRLEHAVLKAPRAGIVTVKQAEVGEVVSPGTPVVTIAELDKLWLRAYVPETDLARIHYGQDVSVTTDTYPGKTYHGHISFISPQTEFTPKSVETHKERVTLVYRIKIDLDNPNLELKPGMPADATIDLAQK